jgi:hypothetical protein
MALPRIDRRARIPTEKAPADLPPPKNVGVVLASPARIDESPPIGSSENEKLEVD